MDNKEDAPVIRQSYLEIYIQEDGKLMLMPLTKDTASVFKAITDNKEEVNIYCG